MQRLQSTSAFSAQPIALPLACITIECWNLAKTIATNQIPMPKLPCDTCRYCAQHYAIVCALHLLGPMRDSCVDYEPDPELNGPRFIDFLGLGEPTAYDDIYNPCHPDPEENWAPDGWAYVNGELVRWEQPSQICEGDD